MNNRTIEVIVTPTGEIEIDAVRFKGTDCEKSHQVPGRCARGSRPEDQETRVSPVDEDSESPTDQGGIVPSQKAEKPDGGGRSHRRPLRSAGNPKQKLSQAHGMEHTGTAMARSFSTSLRCCRRVEEDGFSGPQARQTCTPPLAGPQPNRARAGAAALYQIEQNKGPQRSRAMSQQRAGTRPVCHPSASKGVQPESGIERVSEISSAQDQV